MIKIIYLILWTLPTILRYIRNDLFCLLYSKRIARLSKDNPLFDTKAVKRRCSKKPNERHSIDHSYKDTIQTHLRCVTYLLLFTA